MSAATTFFLGPILLLVSFVAALFDVRGWVVAVLFGCGFAAFMSGMYQIDAEIAAECHAKGGEIAGSSSNRLCVKPGTVIQ